MKKSRPECSPKEQERQCYYHSLRHSIRASMTPVRTESDEEFCQACCYPCTLPVPYVDSAPIIDVTCTPVVWILGPSGDDTRMQCKKVLEHLYCMVHISVKDMICEEAATASKRAGIIKMMMDKGTQVPTELVLEMIREKIVETRSGASGYLIEGFPRERRQGIAFEKAIAPPSVIIYLEASIEALFRRQTSNRNTNKCCCCSNGNHAEARWKIEDFMNEELLHEYWRKVRYINTERSDNEICCDILYILNPIMSEALKYRTKKLKLKKLLIGQS